MINDTLLPQLSFMEHKAVLVGWHTPAKYIFMEQNPICAFGPYLICLHLYCPVISLKEWNILCLYIFLQQKVIS